MPGKTNGLVTLEDVRAAAVRIRGIALRTPLLRFPDLSEELGADVRLKCESLQRTGSFKVRGAVIFLSQLRHLLGIKISGGHSTISLLVEVGRHIGETNIATLIIGLCAIGILLYFKKKFPRFPAALIVVLAGGILVYFFRLDNRGVGIVGNVPRGLPRFTLPSISWKAVSRLLPTTLTILFVGFMESIAVAELIASKEKYKVDPNRELVGLGRANLAGAFFSGYPVTGGFSRTAVNYQAGAKTGLASIITALLVLLTLVLLTPLFYFLPTAVLAAIIAVAVLGLVNVRDAVRLFRIKTTDGLILVLTFALTLFLGIEKGIIAGVIFSLLVFIWRSSHPHTAELGYLEKEGIFRNIKRFPEAKTFPGIMVLRVDASMYFANMAFIEDCLRHGIEEHPDLKCIVFDLEGVNDIDAVAISILEELIAQYKERGIRFVFASMKGPVRDLTARAGWKEKYGEDVSYLSVKHALDSLGIDLT